MRLTFLGKETQGGGSPTLFATDRNTYVVQGWRIPGRAIGVEIPFRLLRHLSGNPRLGTPLVDTGRGSYLVSGAEVTDPEALSQMSIPDHETCVEVGKDRKGVANGVTAG